MIITILEIVFLILGIICIYASAISPNARFLIPIGVVNLFFLVILVLYPYTIEKIVLRIKIKKFIENMKLMDTSYVLEDESKFNNMKVYKQNIISEIVKNVNSEYIYTNREDPQKYKELAGDKYSPYIRISTLYKYINSYPIYNNIYVKDCILGKTYKNQIFKMSNIRTEFSNSKGVKSTIFEGIFLCVEKSNNIYSSIKIGRKGINTGFWNIFRQKSNEKLDYEFKELLKYYTISAKNVDDVNKHISDRFIDYLIQVKKEFPFEFEILFDDENTYLRIFTGKIFKQDSIKKEKIDYYYGIIKYTTDMINNISNLIK